MVTEKEGDDTKESFSYPKRYLITAAQGSYTRRFNKATGETENISEGSVAALHENLMRGFDKYCKLNNAELIVLKMPGKSIDESIMHESLADREELFFGNRLLNSNVKISDMVVPPQNVDPAVGRQRFAQKDTTLIYAHTKQRLRAVPASNSKLPKLLVTTGAITSPNYDRSNNRGDLAYRDHTYGGVVVEVIDNKCYNVRFLRSRRDGQFVDLGKQYNGNSKPANCNVEALVLGDIHAGDEDPKTMAANYEMIDFFKPQRLILHDLFDGHSINPHESNQIISRITQYESGRLSLEKELDQCREVLCKFAEKMKNGRVYVVASNHPFFLNRYLQEGNFMRQEPWNAKIALELARKMCDVADPTQADPVEIGLKMRGSIPDNVTFLGLRDDLKVWGYQLASHGHKGLSGAKNSNALSREVAHGKSITGHTHTPEVFRNTYIVGTSSKLDLNYTAGSASSWMAANAIIYNGGTVQLIPVINGKWKIKE